MTQQGADGQAHRLNEPPTSGGIGHVIGVDIGGTNLRLSLADMTGLVVRKWSGLTVAVSDADAVVGLICTGVDALLEEASLPHASLRALAAGAPGITDTDRGIVIATSYLMGWRNVPLRALLEGKLGVPVSVENDVNVAALGESWAGAARGISDFVFLAIGTGIGAGIVLNGQLFRGKGWAAGEVGYMLVPGVSETPVEPGTPGALEDAVGGEGVKAQWQRQWSESKTSLPKNARATEIFDHALEQNPLAQEVLQFSARTLAYAIYNMSVVLNCPLFVLGGGVGRHPALFDATRRFLEQRKTPVQPQVLASTLGSEAQLTGAIFLALETARALPR
ncbi:MAG: ROK family protein [Bryobacteraceae bacterium]